MTGYTVHTGSSVKFSSGWDRIFEGSGSSRKAASGKGTGSSTAARLVKKAKAKPATAKKKGAAKKATSKKVKRGK